MRSVNNTLPDNLGACKVVLSIVPAAPAVGHAHRVADLEQAYAALELAAGHYAHALGDALLELAELRLARGAR